MGSLNASLDAGRLRWLWDAGLLVWRWGLRRVRLVDGGASYVRAEGIGPWAGA